MGEDFAEDLYHRNNLIKQYNRDIGKVLTTFSLDQTEKAIFFPDFVANQGHGTTFLEKRPQIITDECIEVHKIIIRRKVGAATLKRTVAASQ